MKLIIQIPCYNEEATLAETLACLPRKVRGFSSVEFLVIDDGSTDRTVEVAHECGVDHIHSLPHNQGLAAAYMSGLETALCLGADVVVNTDGDNQYKADFIKSLTRPILSGEAQLAIGARPIGSIAHFSPVKRMLQWLGSWVVRKASGLDVADAPSGFRAIHRSAAVRLFVFNRYTYTLETIIQAGYLNIPVISVPVGVNPPTRKSRLMRSTLHYIMRSAVTIFRIAVLYRPFRAFSITSALLFIPGAALFLRFLYQYASGDGSGHVQSLVIGATLIASAAILFVGGIIADLIAANRTLLTEIRARQLNEQIAQHRRGMVSEVARLERQAS